MSSFEHQSLVIYFIVKLIILIVIITTNADSVEVEVEDKDFRLISHQGTQIKRIQK